MKEKYFGMTAVGEEGGKTIAAVRGAGVAIKVAV
jgi:hypothetical protein